MDRSFHYLLMASLGLFQRRVLAALSGTGLTAGQPKILDYLGLHDGSMQKDIAAGCLIDPATLTGLLGRMEEKGLIVRRMRDGNRRSLHVYLTEAGWEQQKQVRAILEQVSAELLEGWSEEEKEDLLDQLYRLCSKMTDVEGLQ